ncbi:helix-turn-helix domain-containing protein [Mucilaginibacter daejeonensis]|uniref:helix-turn-helix domain-containing protein n=1 Tax=Mucilaginibacter daejeonensis TaxID=398049 RepID=UPI001D179086|nr:helix-turn-helix transcriptional regulator [Mucilaginibacter daejeonensis]UEG51444.1 helix-turn-helix domain-containing protein [Mucilaginibacter daejeonensis]
MDRKYTRKASVIVDNIRTIRIQQGLSQDQVASTLGISQNAYSKLELGYSKLRVEQLICLSDVFNVDIKVLVKP